MRIQTTSILLAAFFILSNCNTSTDPTEEMIKNYLAESTGMSASSIKITKVSEPSGWLASDSLEILLEKFNALRDEKVGYLEAAIITSKKAIEQAEEAKNGDFAALNDIADETITQSMETILIAQSTIEALNGDCKGTSLEGLFARIKGYSSQHDEALFQRIYGNWSKGGDTREFDLRVNNELTEVLGQFLEK